MMINKDKILNSSKVLCSLLEEHYEDLTLRQYKELEVALENCFKIVERRNK